MPKTIQEKPGKVIQCIRMLKILKSKRFLKKEEIASLLGETTTRNINNYKNALYDAGYEIEYKPGKFGGYHLVHDQLIPSGLIRKEQLDALSVVFDYVQNDKNFVHRSLLLDFIANILGSHDSVVQESEESYYGFYPLAMSDIEIQKRYYILRTAIDARRKVRITYRGTRADLDRIIHPYKLYKYQNWHVYAVDTRENQIGINHLTVFKLHRIQKIELLDETFEIDPAYEEAEHFDENGLVDEKPIHVKLNIYGPMGRTLDEKIYGENQTITLENTKREVYTFEAEMRNRFLVIKFVLSFGDIVKVLEPRWLQQVVVENARKILEFYKRDDL